MHEAFIQPFHNVVELSLRKKLLPKQFRPDIWIEEDSDYKDILVGFFPLLLKAVDGTKPQIFVKCGRFRM